MFCPYKHDQQLQIISNIITKNYLRREGKLFEWQVCDFVCMSEYTNIKMVRSLVLQWVVC